MSEDVDHVAEARISLLSRRFRGEEMPHDAALIDALDEWLEAETPKFTDADRALLEAAMQLIEHHKLVNNPWAGILDDD